ncbi:MAG: hypothetical protein HC822_18800, partial [Oscillochloris sp.]|nr:hypothetical protein [Oscillochloris sp.]
PPPADDLGAELTIELQNAGFQQVRLRAYLLEPPGLTPLAAALPLAAWPSIQPHLPDHLDPALQIACAEAEAEAEPDPMPILLIAEAQP